MDSLSDIKMIKRLSSLFLITIIISLIIVITRYIGLNFFFLKIFNAFTPVFIAIFISFTLEPAVSLIDKVINKRKISVVITYFLILILMGVLSYFTVPSLVNQIELFVNDIPNLIDKISLFFTNKGFNFDIRNILESFLLSTSSSLLKYLDNSLDVLFDVFLGVSGAVFLSFDFFEFKKKIKESVPSKIKEPLCYYFKILIPLVYKYFLGILIDSVFILIISCIGFLIIDMEFALVLSIIIAITNLIPIVGPYIGGIPAVIVGFSISNGMGISALIVVVIVQLVESNFIQPIILKNIISLHPLEGILGISVFGSLFGVIGMILSPILMVAIKLLFVPYKEKNINLCN